MKLLHDLERRLDALVRKATERSLGRPTEANVVEIRSAVLDQVETAAQPVGRGEKLFPFDRLVLQIAAPDPRQRAMLEAALRDRRFLEEIRKRVRRSGAEPPRGMTLQVICVDEPGPAWTDLRYDLRLLVVTEEAPTGDTPNVQLRVTEGRALKRKYPLAHARVNIGRRSDVVDGDEQLVRRNDVAFDEDGQDAVNLTVSRMHAHLWYEIEERSWRIADDGSVYGTRVFREGRSIEVPTRDPRGIRLRPGDEIHCGQACLRFELMGQDTPRDKHES